MNPRERGDGVAAGDAGTPPAGRQAMGGKRRRFLCGCGRFVSVLSNKPRPGGSLCLRYHKRPDGQWCIHNRLVLNPAARSEGS